MHDYELRLPTLINYNATIDYSCEISSDGLGCGQHGVGYCHVGRTDWLIVGNGREVGIEPRDLLNQRPHCKSLRHQGRQVI